MTMKLEAAKLSWTCCIETTTNQKVILCLIHSNKYLMKIIKCDRSKRHSKSDLTRETLSLFLSRKRWSHVFSDNSIGVDLRQAVKDNDGFNPCEDGLRSICWKAFLLYGPPSQASWPKKLGESRSAYTSLRDHFLKYIDHPDDLQSAVDPLADDDNVCALSSVYSR